MQGYIYLIENKINGKKYVGQTSYSITQRFQEHIRNSNRFPERTLYRAFHKYGIDSFDLILLEEVEEKELSQRECFWIQKFNTYQNGYNETLGGEGTSLYNKEEIIEQYQKIQCINDVAILFNCDRSTVQRILTTANIPIKENTKIIQERYGNNLTAYNPKTKEKIKSFSSQSQAGEWIIQQQKTTITNIKKLSYVIGRAARGLDNRKTAYGYDWKFD